MDKPSGIKGRLRSERVSRNWRRLEWRGVQGGTGSASDRRHRAQHYIALPRTGKRHVFNKNSSVPVKSRGGRACLSTGGPHPASKREADILFFPSFFFFVDPLGHPLQNVNGKANRGEVRVGRPVEVFGEGRVQGWTGSASDRRHRAQHYIALPRTGKRHVFKKNSSIPVVV